MTAAFNWETATIVEDCDEPLGVCAGRGCVVIARQEWLSEDLCIDFAVEYAVPLAKAILAAAKEASRG
jgi:hypothetical protein